MQSAQGWRYARSYLDFLGPDRLQLLGYPAGELARKLESFRPPLYRRLFTLPFLFSMSTHNVLRRIYRRLLFKEAIF